MDLVSSDPSEICTRDLRLRGALLYLLSYRAKWARARPLLVEVIPEDVGDVTDVHRSLPIDVYLLGIFLARPIR